MTGSFGDLFGSIFGGASIPKDRLNPDLTINTPNDTTRNRMANRAQCAKDGHRYRVHGKQNPSKVECGRCEVSWAIGPRTEPPA